MKAAITVKTLIESKKQNGVTMAIIKTNTYRRVSKLGLKRNEYKIKKAQIGYLAPTYCRYDLAAHIAYWNIESDKHSEQESDNTIFN